MTEKEILKKYCDNHSNQRSRHLQKLLTHDPYDPYQILDDNDAWFLEKWIITEKDEVLRSALITYENELFGDM